MTTTEIGYESVYVYRFSKGKLKRFEGWISSYPWRIDNIFHDRNSKRQYVVSKQPCKVYNGNLWMFDPNDEMAREFFVRDYTEKIEKLNQSMEYNFKQILILLKGDS